MSSNSKNGTKSETTKTAESGSVSVTESPVAEKQPVMEGTSTEKKSKTKESLYTIDEFCNNAKSLFNTMPECVRAALKEKGIEQCDKAKAEKIVKEFMKKEVK